MGCNQSTEKDVCDNRQRINSVNNRSNPPPAAAIPQAIDTGVSSGVEEINTPLGVSYTDERVGEQDYFRDIIARTAENFIDVSQNTVTLDSSEVDARQAKYLEILQSCPLGENAATLFSFPTPSRHYTEASVSLIDSQNQAADPHKASETSPFGKRAPPKSNIVCMLEKPTPLNENDKVYLEQMCHTISEGMEMDSLKGFGTIFGNLSTVDTSSSSLVR
eukprot:Sdes_comp18437_c0_seq2m8361